VTAGSEPAPAGVGPPSETGAGPPDPERSPAAPARSRPEAAPADRTGPRAGSQTALFRFRVRDFMRPTVMTSPVDASVREVVAAMAARRRTAAVLTDEAGRVAGILTERDVTRRIAVQGAPEGPVAAFATRPVHTIAADDYLYRAVARMRRLDLRHLPVVDNAGRPIGMVDLIDAVASVAGQMLRQLDRLTRETTTEGLAEIKAAQREIAGELLADNLPASEILALVTDVNLDLHRRVLEAEVAALAEAGWGEPPVPFTLLVMGSGGRGENFLHPDQDNGFILADYGCDDHRRIDPWFVALAERFNAELDRIGFPLCKGHVMARNPLWRKTATEWRDQVALWARRRSPVAVLFADIFFDFRAAAGPPAPAAGLRAHVTEVLKVYPALLSMMSRDETVHSVALGLFGRLRADRSAAAEGRVDLKLRGTLPLVSSLRLWALKRGIAETGTLARLAGLREAGVVTRDDADELASAFERVTFALLRQQLRDAEASRPIGNLVDPKALLRRERDELVASLRAIERFRRETHAMFTGGVF
jgi:signal-transduction protein with cAMP-binding, CBS, and nucleotidyltransferase domain